MKTEEGKDAYRILKLKSRTEPHRANLKQDYNRLYNMALTAKKEEKFADWVNKNAQNAYIRISERYLDCGFSYQFIAGSSD